MRKSVILAVIACFAGIALLAVLAFYIPNKLASRSGQDESEQFTGFAVDPGDSASRETTAAKETPRSSGPNETASESGDSAGLNETASENGDVSPAAETENADNSPSSDSEAKAQHDMETETVSKSETEPASKTGMEAAGKSETEPASRTGMEAAGKSETETANGAETETAEKMVTAAENKTETEKEEETEAEKEDETKAETQEGLMDVTDARTLNAGSVPAHRIIWVGDSRTLGMRNALKKTDRAESDLFVGQVGEGVHWFLEEGMAQMADAIRDNPGLPVVLNFGVNDPWLIDEYKEAYRQMISKFPDTDFYFLSVNPVDEEFMLSDELVSEAVLEEVNNLNVAKLNVALKKEFESRYLDSASLLKSEGFETVDGLHFTKDTYLKIHDFVVEQLF